jgi:uncharacterized phage protein (TIGR01671 family)
MREILFRGKSLRPSGGLLKKENGWVFGVPVPVFINTSDTGRVEMTKCHGYDELDYYELLSEDEEVDPKTIGQYTGMKDKNGTKIFEGDIVRVLMDYGPAGLFERNNVVIRFNETAGGYEWQYFNLDTIEVIGNIYDNPELLEKSEEDE